MLVILSIFAWVQGKSAFYHILVSWMIGSRVMVHRPLIISYTFALGSVNTDDIRFGYWLFSQWNCSCARLNLWCLIVRVAGVLLCRLVSQSSIMDVSCSMCIYVSSRVLQVYIMSTLFVLASDWILFFLGKKTGFPLVQALELPGVFMQARQVDEIQNGYPSIILRRMDGSYSRWWKWYSQHCQSMEYKLKHIHLVYESSSRFNIYSASWWLVMSC